MNIKKMTAAELLDYYTHAHSQAFLVCGCRDGHPTNDDRKKYEEARTEILRRMKSPAETR